MSRLSIAQFFPFSRVKVVSQNVHDKATSAMIYLDPDLRYKPLCHICGRPAGTIHSKGHRRIIRDLNMASAETWLQVEYRRIWCNDCDGTRVERLDFADASVRVTKRFARYIADLCRTMTVEDVARHLKLDRKTVAAIDYAALKEEFGKTDYTNLRILAIDEIAVKKGHQYMTVVLDYLTGRVVWMGEGRNKETLDKFFAGMSETQKEDIDAVAIDMWEPYINRIEHHCPHAMIVFDFFHVVQAFGRVIDEVRRDEFSKSTTEHKDVIKGSRYLLLRNAVNLNDKQQAKLKDVLALNKTLSAVYILKDQLHDIYRYGNRKRAKHALDLWCSMAGEIDHPAIRRFIKRLRFFEYGILNHCDYPIGTSRLEGVNNKIKVIKRKAYGYHNQEYFTLKVKQALPGKKVTTFIG